jgi:phage terminase large subunit-like protein
MADEARTLEPRIISPQPGPQTTFARTSAEVAFFGGSPGGGKSTALLYEGAKLSAVPHARAVRGLYLRRREIDLLRGGGLWDKSEGMFPAFGGRAIRSDLAWIFEAASGRIEDRHRLELRHMHHESDRFTFDGSEYDIICFDELQQFSAVQFWYLLSRLRSVSGLRPRMRATLNPSPDSWLADFLGWYIGPDGYVIRERSGVIRWFVRDEQHDEIRWYSSREEALDDDPDSDPMSFTFILSLLDDNPALTEADPGYRRKLRGLMRVDRMRLIGEKDEHGRDRGGNWKDHAEGGGYFDRADFQVVDAPPAPIVRTVRGWDRGASAPTPKHPNPDWTEGALVSVLENGALYIEDLASAQLDPIDTSNFVVTTADRDGPLVEVAIFQDTGGAGKTDAHQLERRLDGYAVTIVNSDAADQMDPKPREGASRAKRALAKPWASLVRQKRVYLRRAPWNAKLLQQAHRFPLPGSKDDVIDGVSCAVQALDLGSTSLSEAMLAVGRRRR